VIVSFKQSGGSLANRLKRLQEIVQAEDEIQFVFITDRDELETVDGANVCVVLLPKGVDGSKLLD
jgi:hypothetical protein